MNLYTCNHWSTCLSNGLYFLYCFCQCVPYQVWWRVLFDPLLLSAVLRTIFIFPLVPFFYKVRRPTSWTFGKISRYLLRSSGFHFDRLCSTFSEEAPEWSELDDHYHASFIECSIWYSQVSLLLLMGWLVNFSTLVWWNYCGLILVPWFFLERGSAVFGRTTSRLRAMTR